MHTQNVATAPRIKDSTIVFIFKKRNKIFCFDCILCQRESKNASLDCFQPIKHIQETLTIMGSEGDQHKLNLFV